VGSIPATLVLLIFTKKLNLSYKNPLHKLKSSETPRQVFKLKLNLKLARQNRINNFHSTTKQVALRFTKKTQNSYLNAFNLLNFIVVIFNEITQTQLPISCVKRLYTFRQEFNTFSRKVHPTKINPIVPHPFLQHNPQLKFLPQPNLPVPNFLFSRITNFKFYKYTSSRFYLHSKKASIITTLIDLPTLLNTQPTYLTTSQHTALKHIYKSPSSYPELCQYSRAIFFRYN
jgi:hypothetical protein